MIDVFDHIDIRISMRLFVRKILIMIIMHFSKNQKL